MDTLGRSNYYMYKIKAFVYNSKVHNLTRRILLYKILACTYVAASVWQLAPVAMLFAIPCLLQKWCANVGL